MSRSIIAILRGIRPEEAAEIAHALVNAGIDQLEVPLNSPSPFESIRIMLNEVGDKAQVGAGTVLKVADVETLSAMGAQMVISPNCNTDVIKATKAAGMLSYPGVMTPTECFSALDAGADGLKFFPSSLIGPSGLAAINAVLPPESKLYAVGGAGADNFNEWVKAGATGFGIGSALYKSGNTVEQVAKNARIIVEAYDHCEIDAGQ